MADEIRSPTVGASPEAPRRVSGGVPLYRQSPINPDACEPIARTTGERPEAALEPMCDGSYVGARFRDA
jgi:hypothetical protein